jgi:uncharacterized membrane protein
MIAPSVLWGLGLGVSDGALYSLIRETYEVWQKGQKPNGPVNYLTTVWQNLILAGLIGGLVVPYFYFWAIYSVGSIAEIHILRCLVSVLISLFIGFTVYKDNINGYRAIGLLFTIVGLVLVLGSTAYGKELKIELKV